MEPGHFLPVHDVLGFFACILGVAAQLWLGRYWRIPLWVTTVLSLALLISYFSIDDNLIPEVRRAFPAEYRTAWIPGIIRVYFISLAGMALLLFIRSRVPRFRSERRDFLRLASAAACATPAAAAVFGIVTRKDFEVNEIALPAPRVPKDLQNLRILQLSDIHLGQFFEPRDLARIVDAANQLRPDLVMLTGDFITTSYDPLEVCLQQLSRLKHSSGIWACLGNHEMFAEVEDRAQLLAARLGINVLRHQAARLSFGNHHLNLVGVDYQTRFKPYLANAEELVSAGDLNLLLSHNPDVFPKAVEQGFDVVLAGHTHGGQVNVEIFNKNVNLVDFFTPYTKGLYRESMAAIYVNAGIGTIGVPLRIGAPPEISLIRLCASSS